MPNKFYGADVSSWNGTIDWSKAKGIDFCIIRITQLYGIDTEFETNYSGCRNSGIKVGVYRYSYARNAEESKKEAEDLISVLDSRPLDFPVFLDLEWEKQETFSKSAMGSIIEAFREVVTKAGYKFGIYTNKTWYDNLIPDSAKQYDFWIASVPYEKNDNGEPQERLRPGSYAVGWQYSWKGSISGLSGKFDLNEFSTDYSDKEETIDGGNDMPDILTDGGVTAQDVIAAAEKWLGRKESDNSHRLIIDTYNAHKPLARGYKVKYTDAWCDTFVSAVFITLNATDLIGGTECGVENHVALFKAAGIWNEDGTVTPKPGWIIVYNWDKNTQPNDGYSDHIGIVKSVNNGTIAVIEGNYKDSVAIRQISVGHGNIRGYAMPKYSEIVVVPEAKVETKVEEKKSTGAHNTIQLGSTGEDVKLLQQYLNKLGYYLEVDGSYGMKTYAAATSFQNHSGLYVDGIIGPLTWAALDNAVNNRKSVEEIAKEVIAGKWGNQPDRKRSLAAAGYTNYEEIQNKVNELLKK